VSRVITLGRALCLLALSIPGAMSQQSHARQDWETFRRAYPYHIQLVAVGDPYPNGGRTLIVSEPPPQVTIAQLREVDPALLANYSLWREQVGFDGWLKDAVFELPPLDDAQYQDLIAKIHIRLFGTAYKAVAVSIPKVQPKNSGYQFDLHVPSSTLAKWLLRQDAPLESGGWFIPLVLVVVGLWGLKVFGKHRKLRHGLALGISGIGLWVHYTPARPATQEDQVRFTASAGGEALSCRDILRSKAAGVFLSEKPGLVIWSFSRTAPLDSQTREARQFALDSDILLGAIGSSAQVAVIGRERVAPISILPPLRTETIMQLASVQQDELSQSYERTDFLAGRLGDFDGNRRISLAGQIVDSRNDWAPIYLSRQLIDTEYGSLLNITDQLLKSWSMHGLVRYVNFPYPDPADYPFPEPLAEHAHANQVLFNWNTKGAGYSAPTDGLDVFAWNRTGALPVDYFGNGNSKLREAEEIGYAYFARTNDPNLVRVVQYAELYQVFRHFGVTAAGPPPAMAEQPRPGRAFRENLLKMLRRVHSSELTPQAPDGIVKLKAGLDNFVDKFGEDALVNLADAIGDPRVASEGVTDSVLELAGQFHKYKYALLRFADLDSVTAAEKFIQASRHATSGWIHTPSIVVSRVNDPQMPGATGGHNLDAKITSFRTSDDVASGKVTIAEENGQRVVLYNKSDAEKIPETVRAAARDATSEEQLKLNVENELRRATMDERPMRAALGFSDAVKPEAARGMQLAHVETGSDRTGWWVRSDTVTEPQSRLLGALNTGGRHTIVIERTRSGSYHLYDGPSQKIIEAGNRPAAIDAMLTSMKDGKSDGPVRLHLRGFEPREGKGFTKSAELRLAGMGGETRQVTATIEHEPLTPEELKAMLIEKYKFDEIKVTKVSDPFLTERGEVGVDVEAEVKPVRGVKALLLRFRVILREGVQMTHELMAAIHMRITNAFKAGELQAGPEGTLFLTKTLIRDLERISPDIKYVEGRVVHESKDVYIGDNRNTQRASRVAVAAA
jgi:hypothetical protein